MKRIILNIAVSLDQRIAEPCGSLEWLTGFSTTVNSCKDVLASADTIIMGGRTYRELLNMDVTWPYPEQMTYIVSRNNWGNKENTRFITSDVIESISALRNEPGKNICLVGGAELISMLLSADLIDEMQICYIPVILGSGIPLFHEQANSTKWELKECTAYTPDIMKVTYGKIN